MGCSQSIPNLSSKPPTSHCRECCRGCRELDSACQALNPEHQNPEPLNPRPLNPSPVPATPKPRPENGRLAAAPVIVLMCYCIAYPARYPPALRLMMPVLRMLQAAAPFVLCKRSGTWARRLSPPVWVAWIWSARPLLFPFYLGLHTC